MGYEVEKNNLINIIVGGFFVSLSTTLVSFFLPFYLKEAGFGILEIGLLFTIAIAIGHLIFGGLFGKFQKKIKIKTGLALASFLAFFQSFVFVLIPSLVGVGLAKALSESKKAVFRVSNQTALMHNLSKKNKRDIGVFYLVGDTMALAIGVFLAFFLFASFGFKLAFLVFSGIALVSLFFYSKVNENTRFKPKSKIKKISIPRKLKLLFLVENLYWFAMGASFALIITFLITDYLSGGPIWIAIIFGSLYITITLSTLLTKKFFSKKNLFKSSILGMFLFVVSLLIIIFSRSLHALLFAIIIEGIAAGVWVPSRQALVWGLVKPSQREGIAGYQSGLRNFSSALGPLFGGLLVTYLGILSPFIFRVAVCTFGIIVYAYLYKLERQARGI